MSSSKASVIVNGDKVEAKDVFVALLACGEQTSLDIENLDHNMVTVDFSHLTRVKKLKMRRVFCERLPPNLESLECLVDAFVPGLEFPMKIKHVVFKQNPFGGMEQQRIFLTEMLSGKILPQVDDITVHIQWFSRCWIDALNARSGIIKHFTCPCLPSDDSRYFEVLASKVENLNIILPPNNVLSADVQLSRLRTITFKSAFQQDTVDFGHFTGNWTTNLEEMTILFYSDSRFVNLDSLVLFLLRLDLPKLKKITFRLSLIYLPTSVTLVTEFVQKLERTPFFFNCFVTFEFEWVYHYSDSSVLLQKDVFQARQSNNYYIEFGDNIATVCCNRSWLPHRHLEFCKNGQDALTSLCLGLTRLKKFKKTDAIVHVDPACLEFIFEGLKKTDFY